MKTDDRPLIAITMGDACGIGPEILVSAWAGEVLHSICRPVAIGCPLILNRIIRSTDHPLSVQRIESVAERSDDPQTISVIAATEQELMHLEPGKISGAAGQASYDFLIRGIELAMSKQVDAIVTLPIHKGALAAAGIPYPGHTEILAEKTNASDHAMMLYRLGLGVAHVTLHCSIKEVPGLLTKERVVGKIRLLDEMMRRLSDDAPRLAVCALNPHASDGGLFGEEESQIIEPAVAQARSEGFHVVGPISADTLFYRAKKGEFNGVAAMYHDQGHIALKLLGWREAVNITLGLPIIRTSVAHGTAFDIVGKGQADATSLLEATRVAVRLCRSALKA